MSNSEQNQKVKIQEQQDIIKQKDKTIDDLETEFAYKTWNYNIEIKGYKEKIEELKTRNEKLEKDLRYNRKDLHLREGQLIELFKESEQLKEQIKEKNEEIENFIKNEQSESINENKEECLKIDKYIKHLQEEIKSKNEEIKSKNEEIKSKNEEIKILKLKFNQCKKILESL